MEIEKKICTRCKTPKELSEFNKSAYRKEGTRSHCKQCEREQANEFYHKNPEPYRDRAKKSKRKMADHLNAFMLKLKKESGCILCQEKEIACLDFHHVIKGTPVTRSANHSYIRFEKELNKCVIVCCNCHRKIHAGLLIVNEKMINKIEVPRLSQL